MRAVLSASVCPKAKDLAEALGMSPQRVSAIVSAREDVRPEVLARIAKAAHLPLSVVQKAFLRSRADRLDEQLREIKTRLNGSAEPTKGRRTA